MVYFNVMAEDLNVKDRIIISKLRENSRSKLTNISKETKIPISTLFDKLNEFQGGVIRKFGCILNFEKLGYPIKANIMIKVGVKDKETLQSHLEKSSAVNSLFKVNNGYNFIVEALFKDIKECEKYTEKLEKEYEILEIKSYYVVEEIKNEDFELYQDFA